MNRIFLLSLLILFSCSKDSNEVLPEIIKPKYQVIISAGEGGSVDSFGGSFTVGNSITVTATPNEGYMFSSWSNGSQSHILELEVTSNLTLVANFELLVNSYDVVISSGEGGSVSNEGGSFSEGSTINVEAIPNDGYSFVSWSNGLTEPNISILVTENINLEATFEELPRYQVTFNETQGGIISALSLSESTTLSSGEFYQGYVITLTAIPDDGYRFKQWIGIDSSSNQIEISIDAEIEISAEFEPIPFDINDMSIVKFPLYNKDTLSGKKINDLNDIKLFYWDLEFKNYNIEETLDYLASENFVIYWDKRYDHTNYAIDILRWSEFSLVKILELNMPKPKDFDTHRINIFITRDDEYGEDIFSGTECQCAHADSKGRNFMSFPFYNNFYEEDPIFNQYPTMNVAHELFHVFQYRSSQSWSFSWLNESTAEYFEQHLFGDDRPFTLRFIPHFLKSTNLKLWSGFDNEFDLEHIYGRSIFFHFLEWNNIISLSFLGKLYNDSIRNELIDFYDNEISNFRDVFFNFSMKSSVIDYSNWKEKIINLLPTISSQGQLHELTTTSDSNVINNYFTPANKIGYWGFSSFKVTINSNNNFKIDIDTNFENFRYGLVIQRDTDFSYSEIGPGENFDLLEGDIIYIVIVNIPDSNNIYLDEPNNDYKIRIINNDL